MYVCNTNTYTKWAPLSFPVKVLPDNSAPSESSMSTVVFTRWVTTLLLQKKGFFFFRNKRDKR